MADGGQDQNEYAKVKVNAGTYHKTGQPQTDFIITEPGRPRCAGHLVTDVNGNEPYNKVRPKPLALGS